MIQEMSENAEKSEIIQFFGLGESGYENYKKLHENGIETKDSSLFFFNIISKNN